MRLWFILLINIVISTFIVQTKLNFSVAVFLTSLVIQSIAIYFIFNSVMFAYSLKKIFYLFVYLFFGIAPLVQYSIGGVSFFGSRYLLEKDYLETNMLIILILIIYQISYSIYWGNVKAIYVYEKESYRVEFSFMKKTILIMLATFSFFMVFRDNNYSILSMLFRGGEFREFVEEAETRSSVIHLIIYRFLQPISLMCFTYAFLEKCRNKFFLLILFILGLITCFPTGMPRFAAASLYMPFLLLFSKRVLKNNNFSLIFIFSFMLLFPFLNLFKNFSEKTQLDMNLSFQMFEEASFDSYQSLALITSHDIITMGNQLLGVLFFWVPRSIWMNKPIGSGALMAEKLDFDFTNVSCNYFAEGYINFGFIGVFLFTLLLAYFTAKLDRYYWVKKKKSPLSVGIYLYTLGMLFFILRGDLMSSFAFTMGMYAGVFLIFKYVHRLS